jgi:hypothetical protein
MINRTNRKMTRAVLITAAFVLTVAAAAFSEEAQFLAQVPGGFTAKEPLSFYNRNTLYEYIDGQAVFYNSYGFTRLEHGVYQKGGGAYTVDIYELGSRLSALGSYRQQREEDARAFIAGVEGAIIDYLAVFYKDKYYIEIIPLSGGDDDMGAMKLLGAWTDSLLPGSKDLPPELSLFPPEGIVPGSERYVDDSLISYSFMGRGLTAIYKDPGREKELKVFIALAPGPDKAREIFKGFQGKMNQSQPLTVGGAEGAKGDLPYRGPSIACVFGSYTYGCMGYADEKKAAAILASLGERLKKAVK